MKVVVFGLIVLLAVAHQDYWWWDRIDPLVFGFVPVSLAYHAGVSIAAAILWALAVKFCWPTMAGDGEGADRVEVMRDVDDRVGEAS